MLEGVREDAQDVIDEAFASAQRSRAAPDRVLSLIRNRLERAHNQHELVRRKKESMERMHDVRESSASPAKRPVTPRAD